MSQITSEPFAPNRKETMDYPDLPFEDSDDGFINFIAADMTERKSWWTTMMEIRALPTSDEPPELEFVVDKEWVAHARLEGSYHGGIGAVSPVANGVVFHFRDGNHLDYSDGF